MIKEKFNLIIEKISQSAKKAGRKPEDIKLMAVTKNQPSSSIREAFNCGINIIGENKVQEALQKINELADVQIEWHLIGNIQYNKVRKVVSAFHFVDSICNLKTAKKINDILNETGRSMKAMVQVNIGNEPQKSGVATDLINNFIDDLLSLENITIKGLMAIPPYSDNPENSRTYFSNMYRIFEECITRFGKEHFPTLSMGMSNDFEVAISEGANLVRIGRALFGERTF